MAAEQLTDKENQFKRRARRRLVGAVALVLLMITVLPLVLDDRSGQKTPQPEIAISIPSQDGDFNSKIIPVAASATGAPKPVQAQLSQEKPEAVKPVVKASTAPEPKPATVAEDKVKEELAVKPAAKMAELTSPKAAPDTSKKIEEPVAKPAESKLAEAKLESQSAESKTTAPKPAEPQAETKASEPKPVTAKPSAVKKGTVSVQIGVFSDAAKVKQLKAKIAEKGVQCYTENLQTANGVKIRLRCGPFSGKPEAQQALERVKSAGYDGILVTNQ